MPRKKEFKEGKEDSKDSDKFLYTYMNKIDQWKERIPRD